MSMSRLSAWRARSVTTSTKHSLFHLIQCKKWNDKPEHDRFTGSCFSREESVQLAVRKRVSLQSVLATPGLKTGAVGPVPCQRTQVRAQRRRTYAKSVVAEDNSLVGGLLILCLNFLLPSNPITTATLLKLLECWCFDFPVILETFLYLSLQDTATKFWKLSFPPFCHSFHEGSQLYPSWAVIFDINSSITVQRF